jgi:hypothetical protein
MTIAKISLNAAAIIVSIVGAFAFRSNASEFLLGTLYTVFGSQHIDCSRLPIGRECPVSAYTKGHTKIRNAVATLD